MNLLLIRFSALGDVAMLAPVVGEYAAAHPEDNITVLSKPFHAPLFDDIAPNVHFLGRDPKRYYRGIRGLYRLFRELHSEKYDVICDMHDVLRTKILRKFFRLHGYEVRKIDKHRKLRKLITAQGDRKELRQLPTSFENYRQVLFTGEGERIHHDSGNTAVHSNNYTIRPDSEEKTIGIAPFAAHQGKIYPIERTELVIQLLTEQQPDCRIILFGGGGKEKEIMEAWGAKYAQVSTAAEAIKDDDTNANVSPLKRELMLMRKLSVMVSMDSANMHLASLMGTRVVSIWGATHPYAGFLGWQQSMDDCVQRNDLACRPCSIYGNKPCMRGDMACMDIKPEAIVKRILLEG